MLPPSPKDGVLLQNPLYRPAGGSSTSNKKALSLFPHNAEKASNDAASHGLGAMTACKKTKSVRKKIALPRSLRSREFVREDGKKRRCMRRPDC